MSQAPETDPRVDAWLAQAPAWQDILTVLRALVRKAGLQETLKWGKPCYVHEGSNIAIVQEMKGFLALMFFKGALLSDAAGVLEDQGPNSRSARRMRFTSVDDVERLADAVRACVQEAIDAEDAGLEVGPPPELVLAEELQERLDGDAELKAAFEALTPGRQREYNLHVSDAKQASTRAARIEKQVPRILEGKGLRDR